MSVHTGMCIYVLYWYIAGRKREPVRQTRVLIAGLAALINRRRGEGITKPFFGHGRERCEGRSALMTIRLLLARSSRTFRVADGYEKPELKNAFDSMTSCQLDTDEQAWKEI